MKDPMIAQFSSLMGIDLQRVGTHEAYIAVQKELKTMGFVEEKFGKTRVPGLSAALLHRVTAYLETAA